MKKFAVGFFVAAALLVGHSASAQTTDDLQAQINTLLAQIAALQGGSSSSSAAGCYAFTRDLTNGSQGADVTALQDYLKSTGHFPATTGSTGYFGPVTVQAVASWQSANGVAPAAGYFGAVSRAKYNMVCAPTTGGNSGSSTGGSTGLGGGEADLNSFSGSSGDDNDVEEGGNGDVYEFEFDVEDGDVNVERVDLMFKSTGADGDTKPWKVFDDITLSLNGEELDSVDGGDEDNWDEDADDEYRIRFTGLDGMVEEDDKAEFVVNVAVQSSVDDADGDVSWTIWVAEEGVRALDGEGIDHTIGDSDTLSGADDEEEFDIDEEGEGEELNIKSSSNDPDASTFLVDEDDTSDWYEVFAFRLEAEGGDLEIHDLDLLVTTDSAFYNAIVNDVKIEIDGEEFDDFDVSPTNGATTTATLTFDIDGDVIIDEDDMVEAVVWMEFRSTDDGANYGSGTTTVQVETVSVEWEGATDGTETATVSGDEHTLSTSPATISGVSWSSSTSGNGATGVIDFFFTVEAEEDDVDVLGADILDTVNGTFATSTAVDSDSGFGTLTRVSGDSVTTLGGNAGFTVSEGDKVRFRVRYESTTAGSHEVSIDSVVGQAIADDDQLSPTITLE